MRFIKSNCKEFNKTTNIVFINKSNNLMFTQQYFFYISPRMRTRTSMRYTVYSF